jgi:mannitol/fructose-specific phosphotransferase system IIA component (Ntr-type)
MAMKPTQVVFLLLGSRQEYTTRLKALARIARLIKNPVSIEKIVSSTSVQDMVRAFDEEEAKAC